MCHTSMISLTNKILLLETAYLQQLYLVRPALVQILHVPVGSLYGNGGLDTATKELQHYLFTDVLIILEFGSTGDTPTSYHFGGDISREKQMGV